MPAFLSKQFTPCPVSNSSLKLLCCLPCSVQYQIDSAAALTGVLAAVSNAALTAALTAVLAA
eukprot:scaffold266329_cov18-Tisochrysis_lutea.AAC.1